MLSRTCILATCLLAPLFGTTQVFGEDTRDLTWFLRRLRSLEHLPELTPSKTALASTWDRTGGENDATDFKRIEGSRNILLDVDGPGCIHRIFVAGVGQEVAGTRIQLLLDGADKPLIDVPVEQFFDDRHGPVPYPLVCRKAYPGMLVPIPYARHCRVQLHNEKKANWGSDWQIAYTTYPAGTNVQTMTWPFSEGETQELQAVSARWLAAEKTPPPAPAQWSGEKKDLLTPGRSLEVKWKGIGVLKQWRISIDPQSPDLLHRIRLRMHWDGADHPSVDAPLADFFGYASTGDEIPRYNSLLMGISRAEDYSCFPMPFSNGGRLSLTNHSDQPLKIILHWELEKRDQLPLNWGRFHATHLLTAAGSAAAPRLGPKQIPAHVAFERSGRGKYVGLTLQVIWPWEPWWGQGDWLIWTDESDWPPSYHGTGTEEYFNSGGSRFTRKAISGYVNTNPPERSVYSFHLNDAFAFEKSIRVSVETIGPREAQDLISSHHPFWCTTAFWYAPTAEPAGSSPLEIVPAELDYVKAAASQPATAPSTTSAPAASIPAR